MSSDDLLLGGLILLAALLYASVGHGGASGYLAAMALVGVVPEVMKPTALALNVVVALVATIKFHRAGAFSWPVFWPFALGAIPMAYLGGSLTLPGAIYKPLVGVVLIFAAWRSLRTAAQASYELAALPPMALRLGIGAALGLLSGLTGVGGGIFLSPLLMIFRWAPLRTISGIASTFILANSIAGLLGLFTRSPQFPSALPWWALAALIGGYVGAEYGSRRLGNPVIARLLALVLGIAGVKMLLAV
ncbi:MAG: sulfite exporter TauE/SafE family protein [Rhodocyclaceae bacterium]|nr:sulfite exporter TauE/SafE family protein [Rhodocyclaceae bacterium]